jgi:hypothetical protein
MNSFLKNMQRLVQAAVNMALELAPDAAGGGHYAHLADRILRHYHARGITVQIEPPSQGRVDLAGSGPGGRMIGEIKNACEARIGASAWWSYWNRKPGGLGGIYHGAEKQLSGTERGWCAVIDGQVRDYAERAGLSQADLVVESPAEFEESIRGALRFLQQLRRIRSWTGEEDEDISYFTIFWKNG